MIVVVDVVDVDVVDVVVDDDDVVVVNVGIVFFLVQYILFDITMNLSDTFRSTISQFTLQHRLDKHTTIQCQQCVWYRSEIQLDNVTRYINYTQYYRQQKLPRRQMDTFLTITGMMKRFTVAFVGTVDILMVVYSSVFIVRRTCESCFVKSNRI